MEMLGISGLTSASIILVLATSRGVVSAPEIAPATKPQNPNSILVRPIGCETGGGAPCSSM